MHREESSTVHTVAKRREEHGAPCCTERRVARCTLLHREERSTVHPVAQRREEHGEPWCTMSSTVHTVAQRRE